MQLASGKINYSRNNLRIIGALWLWRIIDTVTASRINCIVTPFGGKLQSRVVSLQQRAILMLGGHVVLVRGDLSTMYM